MKPTASPAPTRTLTYDSQLMQDYLQTAGILINPNTTGPAVAALQNADGESEAVVIDINGNLCHVCREPLSDSGWNMYGLGAAFQVIAAVDAATLWAIGLMDGALWQNNHGRWTQFPAALPSGQAPANVSVGSDGTVWALDDTGALYVKGVSITQTPPALDNTVTPVAVRDASGFVHLFCVDDNGALWTIAQVAPSGGWGPWTALSAPSGVQFAGLMGPSLAVGPNADGRLQVFAIGDDGFLHTLWETAPGVWSSWGELAPLEASGLLAGVAVGPNADGRLEVFASGTDGTVKHIWQTAPNDGWSGWASLGAPSGVSLAYILAVGRNQDGRLEVFTLDTAGTLWHLFQTAPSSSVSWSGWASLGAPSGVQLATLAVGQDADGRLEVFALDTVGTDTVGTLWHIWQTAPSSSISWSGWTWLGTPSGVQLATLAVGQDADGRLEPFAQDMGGTLWHLFQTAPNDGWSGWESLGKPAGVNLEVQAVVQDRTGPLRVFAIGYGTGSQTVWQIQQTAPNDGWSGWLSAWWAWSLLGAPALLSPPSGTSAAYWAIAQDGGALIHWDGSQWNTVMLPQPLQGGAVSVGSDGTVWVLSSSGGDVYQLYQYVNGTFPSFPGSLPGAMSFSASGATNLWAIAASDPYNPQDLCLFQYSNGAWQPVQTPPLYGNWNPPQVSVAADGSVWLLDGSGTAWRQMSSSPWRWAVKGVPAAAYVASLTGAQAGSAWAVDKDGLIWSFNGLWSQFQAALPGNAVPGQVAAGAAGTLWAIDTDGNPYQYLQASPSQEWEWQAVPASVLPPLTQAPTTWALGKNGTIWQFQDGGWVQFMHSLPNSIWPAQVVAGGDGSVWALDIHGGLYQYMTAESLWQPLPGAPAGLLQVAVVDATQIWGITQDPSNTGAFALYQYVDGAWQQVAGAPLMSQVNVRPQVSAGPDGTIWLLDGNGIPRAIRWDPTASSWTAKKMSLGLQFIAAAGPAAAWAVGSDGAFWRNFGGPWADAQAPLPLGAAATQVSVGSDGTVWALDDTGCLYIKGAQYTPAPPVFPFTVPPVVCRDASGSSQLFCLDMEVLWSCRWGPLDDWWGGLMSLGGPSGIYLSSLAVGLDQDGRLQVFAIGAGALWHIRQVAPGGGWGSWSSLGAPAGVQLMSLALGANQNGCLQVFALGGDGFLHTLWETAPGVWSSWGVLAPAQNSPPIVSLAVGLDQNGCLAVVAVGTDQAVHYIAQTAPNNGWGSWSSLGAPPGVQLKSLALGANQDGRLQVFALGGDGFLHTLWETAPGVWSSWGVLAPAQNSPPIVSLAVGLDQNGCLAVVAVGTDQAVYYIAQTAPNNGWGSWSSLGAPATGALLVNPAIAQSATGALAAFVFAKGTHFVFAQLWTIAQEDDGTSAWGTWMPLGETQPLSWSPVAGAPPLLQAPSGAASNYWAVNTDGDILNWNGSQWSPEPLPGASTKAASVSVGTDGSVWAVSTPTAGTSGQPTNACYRYLNGAWQQTASGSFAQAPAGSAGDLWCVTLAGGIGRSTDRGSTWWQDTAFPTAAKQLTAGPDGTVWVLDASGTASVSPAWQRIMRPTGMPGWPDASQCTAVVAGQDENGLRYVFFTDQAGKLVYSFEVFPHTWVPPVLLTDQGISRLGLTNQQDTGELIVYGLPSANTQANIQLLVACKAQGSDVYFSATYISLPWIRTPPPFDVELCAVDADHWYWFGLLNEEEWYDTLIMAASSAHDQSPNFYMVWNGQPTLPKGSSIVRLPWARPVQAPYAAVMDGSNNVQMVSVSSLQPVNNGYYPGDFLMLTGPNTQLPNGVTAVAAVLQSDSGSPPQPRIYAMAPIPNGGTNALWVLRQIDLSLPVSQLAAWSNWIPLGGDYFTLANGPSLLDADTLFAVGSSDGGSLQSVAQNPVTGKWTSLEVKRPSQAGDEGEEVATYTTEITLQDGNGIPQANVPVTITAETPVAIWVEDALYFIDADQGVTCPTTTMGRLRTRTLATGLHTPTLTFQAEGLPNGGQSIYPAQHVHDFLAGTGQLAVGGRPPTNFTVSALQAQWSSLSTTSAQCAVNAAGEIAKMPSGASAARTVAGWIVDLSDPAQLTCTPASTSAALAAYRLELARKRLKAGLPGSFWHHLFHGIKHAFDDVVHAIEKGAMKVDSIVVDAENKVVSLTIKIGDQIVDTVDMVVETVEDAMHAIEAILHTLLIAVIKEIEEIIEWLKLLFNWEDILVTHNVIKYCLQSAFTALPNAISGVETLIEKKFNELQSEVTNIFNHLEDYFQPGQTFNQYANALGPNPIGNSLAGALVSTTYTQHASISNYILSKSQAHFTSSHGRSGGSTLALVRGSLGDSSLISDIISAVQANWPADTVQQMATEVYTFVTSKISDPHQFFDLVIVDLLNAAKDIVLFVIEVVEGIVLAILKAFVKVFNGLQSALTARLDIPVISWLYKYVFTGTIEHPGDDLTLLDLLSLIFAVPVTILYKVLFGSGKTPPFSSADYTTLKQSGLPWPTVPSSAAAAGLAAPALSPAFLKAMGVVAGIAAFFGTFITAAADGFTEEPLPGFTQFISWGSIIQGGISQVTGAPWGTFAKPDWNEADGLTTALWAAAWIPFIYDSAFTLATGELARYMAPLGPVLDTGAGWALSGLGAATLISQVQKDSGYTGWDGANSLVPQPARGFKFLLNLAQEDPETAAIFVAGLVIVDLVLGLGGTVTQIGSAIEG